MVILIPGLFYYISQDINILQSKIDAVKLQHQTNIANHILIKTELVGFADNDEEISINGKLYDVTEKKIINDSVYYYGIEDKREQQVINSLQEHFGTDNSCVNAKDLKFSGHKITARGIENLYTLSFSKLINPVFFTSLYRNSIIIHCSGGYKNIVSPPPQV